MVGSVHFDCIVSYHSNRGVCLLPLRRNIISLPEAEGKILARAFSKLKAFTDGIDVCNSRHFKNCTS